MDVGESLAVGGYMDTQMYVNVSADMWCGLIAEHWRKAALIRR
jgi:hypothetical protein